MDEVFYLDGGEEPINGISTKCRELGCVVQIGFGHVAGREKYVLNGAKEPDLIAGVAVRRYVLFERMSDDGRVVGNSIECKNVSKESKEAT